MSEQSGFFSRLATVQKWSLALGSVAIVLLVSLLGWWTMRTPYAVLFSDLGEQDAAVVVQELEKLKVPYQIGGQGQTLLVPESAVHKTRMTLMARQLPLHGTVGFELFNNAEFGVSDFIQKVNYLRAVQGELTRTILSIEQVQSARVHLALPEQGLFRKDNNKAKASVTVVTKGGQSLQPAQVLGIQRLIGASVPDVLAEDVTVLDQHGVTLSRTVADGMPVAAQAEPLNSKVDLEAHLTRKAMKVLDGLFGPGNTLVTVDAVLNHQQVKVTTEEVLAASAQDKSAPPAGVIQRERTVTREAPGIEAAADRTKATTGATVSQDIDYQNGKRTEQVLSPAGALARLNVAVVVRHSLGEADIARLREVVGASVGLQSARGDVISVYSMASPAELPTVNPAASANANGSAQRVETPSPASTFGFFGAGKDNAAMALAALVVSGIAGAAFAFHRLRRGKAKKGDDRMTEHERAAVLKAVQTWLATPEARSDA